MTDQNLMDTESIENAKQKEQAEKEFKDRYDAALRDTFQEPELSGDDAADLERLNELNRTWRKKAILWSQDKNPGHQEEAKKVMFIITDAMDKIRQLISKIKTKGDEKKESEDAAKKEREEQAKAEQEKKEKEEAEKAKEKDKDKSLPSVAELFDSAQKSNDTDYASALALIETGTKQFAEKDWSHAAQSFHKAARILLELADADYVKLDQTKISYSLEHAALAYAKLKEFDKTRKLQLKANKWLSSCCKESMDEEQKYRASGDPSFLFPSSFFPPSKQRCTLFAGIAAFCYLAGKACGEAVVATKSDKMLRRADQLFNQADVLIQRVRLAVPNGTQLAEKYHKASKVTNSMLNRSQTATIDSTKKPQKH